MLPIEWLQTSEIYKMTNQKAKTWEFLLEGNPMLLRNYSTEDTGTYLNIYGGINDHLDCKNDDFRMTSVYCEGESSKEVVWQVGYELLSLFNGAHKLAYRDHVKVKIEQLWHGGVSVDFSPKQVPNELLGQPMLPKKEIEDRLAKIKKSNSLLALVHFATEHEDARLILKYFDLEESWSNYYKVLETVESFSKKNKISVEIDSGKRKSFTNTSNNYSLAGIDSRHGFKEAVKENKTPAMDIAAGYQFVSTVAKTYLSRRFFK
jgi:hypothetical protein